MSFKEVAPGVMVNTRSNIKVTAPHPDPCWVIRNPEKTKTIGGEGRLFVFSTEEKLHSFMEIDESRSYVTEKYSWDDLVDKYGNFFKTAMVDPKGEPGFYPTVMLQKEI